MSLVSTLAKVAIGIAVAKGVSSLAKAGRGGQSAGGGTPMGDTYSPQSGGVGGGLGDMMGEILGGGRGSAGTASAPSSGGGLGGGLGGMFDQLPDAATKKTTTKNRANAPSSINDILGSGSASGGGLGDLLGGMLGGASAGGRAAGSAQGGGGLGDLLGGVLGGGASAGGTTSQASTGGGGLGDLLGAVLGGAAVGGAGGGLGDMLNKALTGKATAQEEPSHAQELAAGLMLKCMIQAVKCDGALDEDEKKKLMGSLGDATQAEMKFVNAELAAPLDIEGLAKQIPQGMEAQAYMMSLMAINLDNRNEAQYLNGFAQALELDKDQVNAIHDHVKAPRLYS
jgi:uncharacterized membrane protein YebE (DUF533 family)